MSFPLVGGLVLLIGGIFGIVSFSNYSWTLLLSVFGLGLAQSSIKNIIEEFSWRGYLTPRIISLPVNAYSSHLINGLICGSWHIAYWILHPIYEAYIRYFDACHEVFSLTSTFIQKLIYRYFGIRPGIPSIGFLGQCGPG